MTARAGRDRGTTGAEALRLVAFVGDAQAEALARIYQRRIAPLLFERAIHVRLAPGAKDYEIARARDRLYAAELIVDQVFDEPSPIRPDQLVPPAAKWIRLPHLSGHFYWPYGGVAHVLTPEPWPDGERVPYPRQLGDAFLNRMIAEQVPPEEALRRYDAEVAGNAADIARTAELHLARQREREAACGMALAEFIAARLRHESLFLTPDLPAPVLLAELARQVFAAIGVPSALVEVASRDIRAAWLPTDELPIHPRVAEALQLDFVTPERRYRFACEGEFSFEEYAVRYMEHAWSADMVAAVQSLRRGDLQGGIRAMRSALQECAGTGTAWHVFADALLRAGDATEAETAARHAARIGGPDPDVLATLADAQAKRGNLDDAAETARAAIAEFPDDCAGYRALARVLERRGRLVAAAAVMRVGVGRDPCDIAGRRQLADHLRAAGRREPAAAVLHDILAIDPAGEDVAVDLDRRPPPAAPGTTTVRYPSISLAALAGDPRLRIDDQPLAFALDNLPAQQVQVPPLLFGAAGRQDGYQVTHAAAPAWLLRNVTVHGTCGLVSSAGHVIEETLDHSLLHLLPGALLEVDGSVRLPARPRSGDVHTAFHLLGFATGEYTPWLLDLAARIGQAAFQAVSAARGVSRTPVMLLPPLDRFWQWESLGLLFPANLARVSLRAEGEMFAQWLVYVPPLRGDGFATHPALGPTFDAIRERSGAAGATRRMFVTAPEASALDSLAELAERAGFERVVPGRLPFLEQVRLFAEASHVIAAPCPEQPDIVFCRPGTAVCELRPHPGAPWHIRHLAALRGLRYGCLEGAGGRIDPAACAALLRDSRFTGR